MFQQVHARPKYIDYNDNKSIVSDEGEEMVSVEDSSL